MTQIPGEPHPSALELLLGGFFAWAHTTCWGGHAELENRQQETPVSGCWLLSKVWWEWGQGKQTVLTHIAGQNRQFSFLVGQLGKME